MLMWYFVVFFIHLFIHFYTLALKFIVSHLVKTLRWKLYNKKIKWIKKSKVIAVKLLHGEPESCMLIITENSETYSKTLFIFYIIMVSFCLFLCVGSYYLNFPVRLWRINLCYASIKKCRSRICLKDEMEMRQDWWHDRVWWGKTSR